MNESKLCAAKPCPNEEYNYWDLLYSVGEIEVVQEEEFPEDIDTEELLDSSDKLAQEATYYLKSDVCPCCSSKLFRRKHNICSNNYFWSEIGFVWCFNCAFWCYNGSEFEGADPNKPEDITRSAGAISRLRTFSPNMPEACGAELAQYLRRNPNYYSSINPTAFEKFVADVWRANYAEATVAHIGCSGDKGFDVYYVDANDQDWMIQVKRRKNLMSGERLSTLQALIGSLGLQNKQRGIIVTTANYFTPETIRNAKFNAPINAGKLIKLVDRNVLDLMLTPMLPQEPWRTVVNNFSSELAELIAKEIDGFK